MIQRPIRYNVPQIPEGPVIVKDDFNSSKNQMKITVEILPKENENQAPLPRPLDDSVQKGNLVFILCDAFLKS